MALPEALMAACALCSLPSPSLLAFETERTEGNGPQVYGRARVPCDPAIRAILAPVAPKALRPLFPPVLRALQRGKGREGMVCGDGHALFALAGTGDFASTQSHCASCVETPHRHGTVPERPQLLGAALLPPAKRAVMPLRPAPMIQPDGPEQNDGARPAAKRFSTPLRQDHPHLKGMVTADRLRATAPPIPWLPAPDLHDMLGGKAGDHAALLAHVAAAEPVGRVTDDDRDAPTPGRRRRCRLVRALPRNEAQAALRGTVLEGWEWDKDTVPPCSWVTDLRGPKGTVEQSMRGGRARWRIDHETCKTLQNQGDHCAHHSGPGSPHLAVGLAVLRMFACLVDQVPQLCCPLCQAVWAKLGSKRRRWAKRRALV
jgi:hypothetical protein